MMQRLFRDRLRGAMGRAFMLTLVGAACTTVTTRYFLPSTQNPLYKPHQAVPVLAEYVRLQCPALSKLPQAGRGVARFHLELDTLGFVSRARLDTGTGDELMDGVFGAVAAQLSLSRDSLPKGTKATSVGFAYACVADSARVRITPNE